MVAAHLLVHQSLDLDQLLAPNRLEVRKVEAQTVGLDQRPLLHHVVAEDMPKRGVQQVGGRMVQRRGAASTPVDLGSDGVTHP